jgi:hypothetical protein
VPFVFYFGGQLDAIHDHLNDSAMERITYIIIWFVPILSSYSPIQPNPAHRLIVVAILVELVCPLPSSLRQQTDDVIRAGRGGSTPRCARYDRQPGRGDGEGGRSEGFGWDDAVILVVSFRACFHNRRLLECTLLLPTCNIHLTLACIRGTDT